jgi:hypothetical protein
MLKTTNGFARGAKYIRLFRNSVEPNAASNKSLDVRRKQRLSYRVDLLLSAGLAAVSAHVTSAVGHLSFVFEVYEDYA